MIQCSELDDTRKVSRLHTEPLALLFSTKGKIIIKGQNSPSLEPQPSLPQQLLPSPSLLLWHCIIPNSCAPEKDFPFPSTGDSLRYVLRAMSQDEVVTNARQQLHCFDHPSVHLPQSKPPNLHECGFDQARHNRLTLLCSLLKHKGASDVSTIPFANPQVPHIPLHTFKIRQDT